MASVLNGGLAAVFGAAFGGIYLPGRVHVPSAPEFDDGGSILPGSIGDAFDCRVQVDACTEAMRREEGFADRDVRLLILSAGLDADVTTDCRVEVLEGPCTGFLSVQSVARDPANAYFDCRGRRD